MSAPCVSVVSCGRVGQVGRFGRQRLCEIRDKLVVSGGRIHTKLSTGHLQDLKRLMSSPPLKMDTLVACKIILGRWPKPSEMAGLFGGTTPLFRQKFHIRNFSMVRSVSAQAGCLFCTVGPTAGLPVSVPVSLYARSTQALERARRLLLDNRRKQDMAPPSEVTFRALYRAITLCST